MNLSSRIGMFIEVWFPVVPTILSPTQPNEAIPFI